MSTATKHRPTPTQQLKARIAELETALRSTPGVDEVEHAQAEAARLDATVKALAEQLSTVSEHLFLTVGTADHDRIIAKRHEYTDRWAVLDGTLMAARYRGRDHGWYPTSGASVEVMFPWTEQEARRVARLLSGQPLLPVDVLPTVVLPEPVVVPEVVTLAEAKGSPVPGIGRHAKDPAPVTASDWIDSAGTLADQLTPEVADAALARVRREWGALRANIEQVPAEPATEKISVPAPKDRPGYAETTATLAETVRDTPLLDLAEVDEDEELLTALGRSIPATVEPEPETDPDPDPDPDPDETAVIDATELRELTGNGDTQTIPIVADAAPASEHAIPPMPTRKPLACPATYTPRRGITLHLPRWPAR